MCLFKSPMSGNVMSFTWRGGVTEEQPLFTSLHLFLPFSPSLFPSLASDVRVIELGAQPLAVRSQLMESTWLTDKPTEISCQRAAGPSSTSPPYVAPP